MGKISIIFSSDCSKKNDCKLRTYPKKCLRKTILTLLINTLTFQSILFIQQSSWAQTTNEIYPVDAASIEKPGVPKGEVLKFSFDSSNIFPGTSREYWVYVPAQYRPDSPACVYISQDGIPYNAPVVFDNLICSKEMPVTIGVFIRSGKIPALDPSTSLDRYNRSVEYDQLEDSYARFLLEEILPDVEKHTTHDGRIIRLSKKANDRAIGGGSSGAIAAFTVAWERPDAFSRVFSSIGGYIGLRGGDRYLGLIRKYEPRPIRIFIQDGTNDANGFSGDIWKANEMMERSLNFAGYEVEHVWGTGGHDGKHATAIFPQAMRWLWKDYPKPVTAGISKNNMLNEILIAGNGWEQVGDSYGQVDGLSVNTMGELQFYDAGTSKYYKITLEGKVGSSQQPTAIAFGNEGKYYTVKRKRRRLVEYTKMARRRVIADYKSGAELASTYTGNLFISSPGSKKDDGALQLIRPDGAKLMVDNKADFPGGLALTPDQSQLLLSASHSHWICIYQIQPDGTLKYKQRYGWLYSPDTADDAGPAGIQCDTMGRIYVATRMGIQVLDAAGRVNVILPTPEQPFRLCFGGSAFNTLYIATRKNIYRRKLNTRGANSFEKPIKPYKIVF